MRYRSLVDKVNSGGELSDEEAKFFEEYKKNHPNVQVDSDSVSQYLDEKSKINRIIEKSKNGSISEEDYNTLVKYGEKHPDFVIPDKVKQVITSYLNNLKSNLDNNSVLYDSVTTLLEQLGDEAVRFGDFVVKSNIIAKSNSANGFIMMESSAAPIVSTGSKISSAGSKVSSFDKGAGYTLAGIGFGLGMYDDMANKGKSLEEATGHNVISTGIGLGTGLAVTGIATLILGATPVGWAALAVGAISVGIGYGLGQLYESAYTNNKDVQDFSTLVGRGALGGLLQGF